MINQLELLGIKIDKNLNFSEHVTKLCKKGNQKLHALARISKYLSKDKLKILMKAFVISQYKLINKLHEREFFQYR